MGLPQAFVELIFDLMDDIARIGNWFRKNPIAGLGVLFLIVFLGLFAQRWFAGSRIFSAGFWERDPEGIRNLIWALATLFAGAAGLYGLLLAGRRTAALDRQAQIAHDHRVLAEQGQITERFTKAVEQLGHSEVAVRLGAIYALERVSKDSARDFSTIMETLAAFIRQKVARDGVRIAGETPHRPSVDILAAVEVIARSVAKSSPLRVGPFVRRIDLRNVDLGGIDLPYADFSGFRLDGSRLSKGNLSNADFSGASLSEIDFSECTLYDVSFVGANLRGANLSDAQLSRSNFERADMPSANFSDVNANRTRFIGAKAYFTKFRNAQCLESNFQGTDLSFADFEGARLDSSNFSEADVFDVNLLNARLDGIDLSGARNLDSSLFAKAFYTTIEKCPKGLPVSVTLPPPLEKKDEIPF